jgi:hypothetical protein
MAGMDTFSPREIAELVETRGVAKARAPAVTTLVLGVVAGAFIALGVILSTIIGTGSELGFGPTRFLSGIGFSLGLILVIVAGAELFTGNNLIAMSWVSGHIPIGRLLQNWAVVYVGILIGALSVVAMVYLGQWWSQADNVRRAGSLRIPVDMHRALWPSVWRETTGTSLRSVRGPLASVVRSGPGSRHGLANDGGPVKEAVSRRDGTMEGQSTDIQTDDDRELRERAVERLRKKSEFRAHLLAYMLVNGSLVIIWAITGRRSSGRSSPSPAGASV